MILRLLLYIAVCLAFLASPPATPPARALDFSFLEGPNLAGLRTSNPTQHAHLWTGINAGAADWSSRLSTNITVNLTIEVQRSTLGIVGGALVSETLYAYSEVRDTLNAVYQNRLPDAPPAFYTGVSGVTVDSSRVWLTTANAKALGLPILSVPNVPQSDGLIILNTLFSFDSDRSDGISSGALDLAGVVAHEIGHTLGTLSTAEGIAPDSSGLFQPRLHDFFRFSSEGVRDLSPTLTDKYLSLDNGRTDADGGPISLVFAYGTGAGGDQAPHWRHLGTGVMDSFVRHGTVHEPTNADVLLFEALGYQRQQAVGANEPPVFVFVVMVLVLLLLPRTTHRLCSVRTEPEAAPDASS